MLHHSIKCRFIHIYVKTSLAMNLKRNTQLAVCAKIKQEVPKLLNWYRYAIRTIVLIYNSFKFKIRYTQECVHRTGS